MWNITTVRAMLSKPEVDLAPINAIVQCLLPLSHTGKWHQMEIRKLNFGPFCQCNTSCDLINGTFYQEIDCRCPAAGCDICIHHSDHALFTPQHENAI